MRKLLAAAAIAAALTGFLTALPARAHDGHDHAPTSAAPAAIVSPRGEASSDKFEVLALAQGASLILFIDRFATNEPVTNAQVEVETPTGPVSARAIADGIYKLDASGLKADTPSDIIVTITEDGASDVLSLRISLPENAAPASTRTDNRIPLRGAMIAGGVSALAGLILFAVVRRRSAALALACMLALAASPVLAHEGHDHGAAPAPSAPAGSVAQRLPDGSVFVPKSAQRIFALRTIIAKSDQHQASTELPGRIIPDPNASGFVQSAIGGRLSAPPGGFPRLGTKVKQGDVLAYVTPPMQAIDVSDMRQRQGELDQQISIAQRKLARNEQLAPSGAVARSALEDSRSEVEGLKERRAMLDKSRREPEALIAPVTGVVADGSAVAGQMAQPNAVVFHIVDPSTLWIEALSFSVVAETQEAFARTAGGKTYPLSYRGSGFADRNQSIPVHFAIEGDPAGLRAGQFVSVLVRTDEVRSGIALPRSALVRAANGQDIVYEHVRAEIFTPRLVRVEPLDGEQVLITAGLEPGKRVVTQAAELIDHVR